jgi:putative sugar O-methyltransferase
MNLWEQIKEEYSNKNLFENFRNIDGFNKRLGSWSPITNNSRYFKSLLFEFSNFLDSKIIKDFPHLNNEIQGNGLNFYLRKISNRKIGNPITINYSGIEIDIDYLLSVEEIHFLREELNSCKSVVEIGPGFGRLVHSILEIVPEIEDYYIIDLDWMLELSSNYLKQVLTTENFQKIKFIRIEDYNQISKVDLVINIDSFQEMEEDIVKEYLRFISLKSKLFYTKNAICKYHPSLVDINVKNSSQFNSALQSGICREVIDIFNPTELEKQKKIYLQRYCPQNFQIIKHQNCFGQYSYYYSGLYKTIKV